MKERLEEMVEIPIGKCDCINAHHKSVILEAIDTSMGILSRDIHEIESDIRKKEMAGHILKSYIDRRINLGATRKKFIDIPDCPR